MTVLSKRLGVALVATALAFTGLTAAPQPAHAAMVCTWMTPHDPSALVNGVPRVADTGAISWNMLDGYGCQTYFPPGGRLYVRVQTLVKAGSTCTGTPTATYSWRVYTSKSWQPLATISRGTCFRLQFFAGNWNSAWVAHRGKLYY